MSGWMNGNDYVFGAEFDECEVGGVCEYSVPRCNLVVTAIGRMPADENKTKLMARPGSQADSIYACSASIPVIGEYCYHKLLLHKQFATISITFKSETESEIPEMSLLVTSSSCGMSEYDLSPLTGEFSYMPQKNIDGAYSFRLFRQADDALKLTVNYETGRKDEIDLGGALLKSGYDWTEPSLRDVDILLDVGSCAIVVSVQGWQSGGTVVENI